MKKYLAAVVMMISVFMVACGGAETIGDTNDVEATASTTAALGTTPGTSDCSASKIYFGVCKSVCKSMSSGYKQRVQMVCADGSVRYGTFKGNGIDSIAYCPINVDASWCSTYMKN